MSSPPMRSVRRRAARIGAWSTLLVLALSAIAVARLSRDLEPEFILRRGSVASVELSEAVESGGHLEQLATVRSTSGLSIDLAIKRPVPVEGEYPARRPLAILLGGNDTGRNAIRLVPDTRGIAVAALSWPYHGPGKPKGLAFVAAIPAIQDGLRDTPPAILLAFDWLRGQPWVDPGRIEIVGVSLGAPFACIAGALDPGFARVWCLHGAASPRTLLEHSLRSRIGWAPARVATAWLASLLAYGGSIAPERWVGRIAPRPFVMVNAEEDERLPRDAIERLYASAREPKELIWKAGRHVEPKRKEVVRDLIETVLSRMADGKGL